MRRVLIALLLLVSDWTLAASQPRWSNIKAESKTAGADLAADIADASRLHSGPLWIVWAAPVAEGNNFICCSGSFSHYEDSGLSIYHVQAAGCALSGGPSLLTGEGTGQCAATLGENFFVFLRLTHGSPERIRLFSSGCAIDGEGATAVWLDGVSPAASVKYLQSLIAPRQEEHSRLASQALAAIALHRDPSADASLGKVLEDPATTTELRKRAAFWEATTRGKSGLAAVIHALNTQSDPSFRRSAVSFLAQSSEMAAARNELIELARKDPEQAVRSQALMALARLAGEKVADLVTDAIDNDPDTEVKKQAVSALAQMPRDEGVPALINVAKNNHNPVVRKQAMFWLGQSDDQRAVDFIESILKR